MSLEWPCFRAAQGGAGAPAAHIAHMAETEPRTTVYFDGACPVCSREMAIYQRADGADRVAFVDAAACREPRLAPDLTRADALDSLHVRRPDGTLVSGAAAFAELWKSLPRWAWLGHFAALPGVRHAAEFAYRGFQRARRLGPWRRGRGEA
jgi:predicted DCC family thiol-disulfide oxidoreductase YuxK